MTKRLFSSRKWKDQLKRRQTQEMKKAQARRKRPRISAPQKHRLKKKRRFVLVHAPEVFSIINNPDETIRFFADVKTLAKKNHIDIDFSGVKFVGTEAIAALIATMEALEETIIKGNHPANSGCRDIFVQSGFFDHVQSTEPLPSVPRGKIIRKQSKKVEPATAKELINLGLKSAGRTTLRCKPAYRTLIESMGNTHNHAGGKYQYQETWWATVYGDKKANTVSYTFVDTGVGIFRSVRVGGIRKLYVTVGLKDDSDILRDILEGKVQSRTGMAYRGKGLPAIHNLCTTGQIKSLVIVANNVYANVSKADYRMLNTEFKGTLLYWEA